MAAIDFPTNPALNDVHTENGKTFVWNGSSWLNTSYRAGTVQTLPTAPSDPTDGDMWWDEE